MAPMEDVPGVYKKFKPIERPPVADTAVFEETIDLNGVYTARVIRDYHISGIFDSQPSVIMSN